MIYRQVTPIRRGWLNCYRLFNKQDLSDRYKLVRLESGEVDPGREVPSIPLDAIVPGVLNIIDQTRYPLTPEIVNPQGHLSFFWESVTNYGCCVEGIGDVLK